jgi:hypothetical protein
VNILAWNPWTSAADNADVNRALEWICPVVALGVIVLAVILLGMALSNWK